MSTVDDLIARSNRLGADRRNTNYAGGNTSAKGTDTEKREPRPGRELTSTGCPSRPLRRSTMARPRPSPPLRSEPARANW